MRNNLLREGAKELRYEIREIVKKAHQIKALGLTVHWENIGDPIEKNNSIPDWMKEIITDLVQDDKSYGYCHSKGILKTREFLANQNNELNGSQITAEDIIFFNGLGDAISTVYQYFKTTSRVIGPSPAYSTHSSAEAANAEADPITYKLDPENHWYPDLEDLYNKIKYNPSIAGILIINPDNPTGMVYPKEILDRIVEIAKEFDLFILSDEIYSSITYNGAVAHKLAEFIGDVPGMAMKGISKEMPWPGSRCGWIEFYNRDKDPEFNRFVGALENAKMIEVCSTTLPQMSIPKILGDPRFKEYREAQNEAVGKRSQRISDILSEVPEIIFNPTQGAFYNTIVFKAGVLKENQSLEIANPEAKQLVEEWTQGAALDFRFVYYLLASRGICVVPISSFCSELQGFRVTLLEENEELLESIFGSIKDALKEYLNS